MNFSSLFCFLLDTFGCCSRNAFLISCLFFSFSVTLTERISAALLLLSTGTPKLLALCSSLFLTLCLRCRGTNLGISAVKRCKLQLLNFQKVSIVALVCPHALVPFNQNIATLFDVELVAEGICCRPATAESV